MKLLVPLITCATIAAPGAVLAEDPTPKNRFGIGLATYNGSAEYTDNDEALVGLTFVYRGDRVFVDENEIGFNFTPERRHRIEALLKRQHFGYDADDAETFEGMEDRHAIVGLGARTMIGIGAGQLWVDALFNPIDDDEVKDADSGSSASLAYALPINVGQFEIAPTVGYQWYSEEVIDFLYGVNSSDATATRSAFEGEDAGVAFTGLDLTGMLTHNLRLSGGLRYESLPDEIANSPLVDNDYAFRASIGLSWLF